MASSPLFDLLNDLNFHKKDLLSSDMEKDYLPYMINRFVSGSLDTLYFAVRMNKVSQASKRLQYDYYLYSIPKRKRFVKWVKAKEDKRLKLIQEYYGYSRQKAREVYSLFSDSDFNFIEQYLDRGGQKGKKKS